MEALLLPILLIAVFYFLLIRPQQRQKRQMQEMQQTLMVGSRVMTGAGLIATVTAIEDNEVVLEVAPGVTNRYVRRAIVNVLDSPESAEPELTEPEESDTMLDEPERREQSTEDRANNGESR